MPELPEVQTVVDSLRPALLGRKVEAVDLQRPDILLPDGFDLAAALIGRRIAEIHRRAKRIVVTLDDQNRFYIHLGMSGWLAIATPSTPREPHTHLEIRFDSPAVLRFTDPRRFGGIWWLGNQPDDAGLGPEPLTINPVQLALRLARTRRNIKAALLDQSLIAGLGNIYVDESLFAAAIHPLVRADRLKGDQVAALVRAIKSTLRRALAHRGSTLRNYRDANGEPGAFQKVHRVYGREGKACSRCGKPITRIVVGGRSTHFCAACQPRRTSRRGTASI